MKPSSDLVALFLALFVSATLGPVPTALAQAAPSPAPSSQSPPSAGTDDNDEARRLYRAGVAAFDADKPEEARRLLLEAWTIRRTYDVAGVLGQVELSLNLHRDAAEHLDFAIRNFPPQLSADALQRVRDTFAQAEKRVATLLVRVDRGDAKILVDGKAVAVTPLAGPLFLDPGAHTIEGEKADQRVTRTVTVEAGATQSLGLDFGKSPPSSSTQPHEESSVRPVALIVGGTLVLVSSAVGVGFAMSASSDRDRGNSLRASLNDGDCRPPGSANTSCAALRKAAEDHDRDRNIAAASFAVAGAALVATATYWFLGRSQGTQDGAAATRVRVGASVAKQQGTLWLSGAF